MNRLSILISAHELSPNMGSECAIGWNIVTRLGKYHDITAVYAKTNQSGTNNYKNSIETFIHNNGKVPGVNFVSVSQPSINEIAKILNRFVSKDISIGFPPIYHFIYRKWQKKVFKQAREMISVKKFDVIHHLTSINFREPGYLWRLGIPFFWGPTGGTSMLIKSYFNYLNIRNKLPELIRNISIFYLLTFSSKIRYAIKKSKLIYAFSIEDSKIFKRIRTGEVRILLDTGAYSDIKKKSFHANDQKLRGIWCGQLVVRKAPELLLRALSEDPLLKEELIISIIPNGPLTDEIVELSEKLKLKNIEWIPGANRDKVFQIMSESDFLIHTSYREATSAIIPEALSHGLPVICHDISGMSVAITENCGIKVPLVSPEQSIRGFKDAMLFFLENPEELVRMKFNALIRAKEISWDKMAETIAKDYYEVLNNNNNN